MWLVSFLHSPTVNHFNVVKCILRYVKGTIHFRLSFKHFELSITGYSDVDWGYCIETRCSTYGYLIFLGGDLVSWSEKKQLIIARSSCESEYQAMANAAAEVIRLTNLLHELQVKPSSRSMLLCDNKSVIFLGQKPMAHK